MKAFFGISALVLLTICSCSKQTITNIDNHVIIQQRGGQTIGHCPESGVKILEVDGYCFKDLNKNDSLDTYEDWRLPAAERAADLAKDLTIDEIAGLMLYSRHMAIPHISTTNPKRYTYSASRLR